ncbi:MAG: redox-regulated ATPase YchF [Chloroflexi bacterium]|nr:redox-regulated ATPase YchF [Chloroflexota bacterium]
MQIGIIGLPLSGKTTIFNALTRGKIETAAFSSGKLEVHTAVVDVPDPRLTALAKMFNPRKTVPAQVQYNDIAGLARGIGEKGGLDGSLLNTIAQNDALLIVVRAFEDASVAHIEETLDPARDLEILQTELILSDLGIVERRLERLQAALKKGTATSKEKEAHLKEQSILQKLLPQLEAGKPLRELALAEDETRAVKNYALLSLKPVVVVVNSGETKTHNLPADAHQNLLTVALQGKLEMELAQMSADDAREFLREYGIDEPGLNKMIRLSYQLLGVQSFFTVGEDECRAWTVRVGANAVDAAAEIHTDLARGFIRAEVIAYADMIACGTLAEARKRGVLRLEGKEYVVKDGDILNIRFNVG